MTTPVPFEIDLEALQALPAEEQRAELAKVAELKTLLERNPLWRYVPHEGERGFKLEQGLPLSGEESYGQREFHEIARFTGAYVAGNRSGKTHGGVTDSLIQTLPEELVPPWLLPFKRYRGDYEYRCRVVGVDLPNWLTKVMLPKIRQLVPPEALWKGSFEKAWQERNRKLQFADGSWWDFLTHDMDVDAFSGADLDRVHFDEEPPGEKGRLQYEESLGRLVDREGEVRWTLTPLLGLNFVYHELTDGHGNPRDDEECKVVRGDIDHNPHLSERGRRRFLKQFEKDPLKLEARKSGRWVHFAGLIYDEFSRPRHVVPEREIPRAHDKAKPLVRLYAAIDPGINKDHPMAIVFAWLDERDVLEVFHVRKEHGWTVEEAAKHFHSVCTALDARPLWTVIDPSARNKHHATGRSIQQEYAEHGIYTLPGQNSREAGFNRVKERLRTDRLAIQAQCEELVNEFEEYRWKTRRQQSEDAPKAEPVKTNDHLLDALRYLVMSMPQAPEPQERRPEEDVPPAERAFRHSLRRIGRRKRARIGGYVPT